MKIEIDKDILMAIMLVIENKDIDKELKNKIVRDFFLSKTAPPFKLGEEE